MSNNINIPLVEQHNRFVRILAVNELEISDFLTLKRLIDYRKQVAIQLKDTDKDNKQFEIGMTIIKHVNEKIKQYLNIW